MSLHKEQYVAAGQKALVFVNTKPGLFVVGFILGALALRLYRG